MWDAVLAETSHRPWPLPATRPVMTMTWQHLLFAHWPLDFAVLRPLIPPALELETYDGSAWVGVVPFQMRNVGRIGVPRTPWMSAFAELNVRTYVRVGDYPGV